MVTTTKLTFIHPRDMNHKYNMVRTGKVFAVRKTTDINKNNVLAIELQNRTQERVRNISLNRVEPAIDRFGKKTIQKDTIGYTGFIPHYESEDMSFHNKSTLI
jgi:hypothetical protein